MSETSLIQHLHQKEQETTLWLQLIKTWFTLVLTICDLAALLPDVFLHRRFGERYLTVLRLGVVYLVVVVLAGPVQPGVVATFLAVHFTAALTHLILAYRRGRRGVRWHSRSRGIPWLAEALRRTPIHRLPTTPEEAALWAEPFLVAAAAFILGVFTPMGLLLAAAALGLWVRLLISTREIRNKVFDVVDGQIEQDGLQQALKGDPAKDTDGYVVPGAARLTDRQRDALTAAQSSLPPIVGSLLARSRHSNDEDAVLNNGIGHESDDSRDDRRPEDSAGDSGTEAETSATIGDER